VVCESAERAGSSARSQKTAGQVQNLQVHCTALVTATWRAGIGPADARTTSEVRHTTPALMCCPPAPAALFPPRSVVGPAVRDVARVGLEAGCALARA